MLHALKPIQLTDLERTLQARIAEAQRNAALFAIVSHLVKDFQGKPVNKRLETALRKRLPGHIVTLERSNNSLRVWGNGIEWEDRETFYLGEPSVVDYDRFLKSNGAMLDECQTAKDLPNLSLDYLAQLVERWNQGVAALERVAAEVQPMDWHIRRNFDVRYH